MTTIFNRIFLVVCVSGLVAAGAGCSSSSSSDAGTDSGSSTDGKTDQAADSGLELFALTPGTWCYTILTAADVNDGCMLGVGDPATADGLVGVDLPVTYTLSGNTGTLEVGKDGSLGQGAISQNVGTLLRENDPTLDAMQTCSFHQTDTSMVTLTATNKFTVKVTEVQSMFADACSAANVPTGGTCTSTWTWTMAINGAGDAGAGCK